MLRNAILALVAVALVFALVLLAWQGVPARSTVAAPAAAQVQPASARTITVIGDGSTFIEPDVAQANVGVNVAAPTIEEASEAVNERMTAVMEALEEQGVAERDVQTANYSIFFEERPQPEGPATDQGAANGQYRVVNEVRVTIRDLDRIGPILDAVIDAGANNVFGVSFTREDADEARSEARADAVADAEAKAEEYAQLNGVTLGEVVSVSEVINAGVPMPLGRGAAEGLGGGGAAISPGQLEVHVQIQVTYAVAE